MQDDVVTASESPSEHFIRASVRTRGRMARAGAMLRLSRRVALVRAGRASMSGCAAEWEWFTAGPRPSDLAGVWIDASKATPSDTVAWVLDHNGSDRTLAIKECHDTDGRARIARSERRYGVRYLQGSLAATADRVLRFETNPRVGGSCVACQRDTLRVPGALGSRRRLLIRNHEGQRNTRDGVLLERSE